MSTGNIIYFIVIIAALIISAVTKSAQAKRKNKMSPPVPPNRQQENIIEEQTGIESLFEKIIQQEKREDVPVEEVKVEVQEPVPDSTLSIESMSEQQLHKEYFHNSDKLFPQDEETKRHVEVDLRQAIIHNAILNRPKF